HHRIRHSLPTRRSSDLGRMQESRSDLQSLHGPGLLLALGGVDRLLQLLALGLEVDVVEQLAHGLGAHSALEVLAPAERRPEAVLDRKSTRLNSSHLVIS